MPSVACEINRRGFMSALDLTKKGSLLREDEFVFLREIEIRNALVIRLEPRAVRFVIRQTRKRDQPECDVVGPLVRHPVSKQVATALRNDGKPALRIGLKQMSLERIELVADEDGDGHELLLFEED